MANEKTTTLPSGKSGAREINGLFEKSTPTSPPDKSGIKGWLTRNWCYLAAFFLPVMLIYIAYMLFGLYPFGDKSVLCLDLNGQYVYYFEAIRDAFHGEGSILYNWSRNLSGGYMGIIGYYLASPLTMIVVLLPRTLILAALLIMILCKLGLASVTFCYYARKSKHMTPLISVMLGTMFGMCAYGIIQTIDPMWLDGLICLPMIALGVEYLVDDGRKLWYIIPLALICIANFYIGFMCCIFTAMYFIFYVFSGSDKQKMEIGAIIKTGLRMVLATAVAISLAAFMILPVYKALSLGKFDFTTPDWSYKSQFTLLEFIAQFCVNQYNSVNVQGKPEIYCGVLAFLCIPLFFMNNRIPKRKRLGYLFLMSAMFFCMLIRPIDMLWHGGQMPNWLPFRYSFIFSFILLSMAAMTLRYITSVKREAIGGSFVVMFVLLMVINSKKYLNMKGAVYLDTFQSIWLTVLFLAFYGAVLAVLCKKNLKKKTGVLLTVLMLCVTCVELTYNAKCTFKDIDVEVAYSTRTSYRQYIESGRAVVDRLYAEDPSFYRAEKTYVRTVNDNSGFKLRGMTHSSSVMNAQILKFIEAMGYSSSTYYSRYDGNTPLADSVLGIKYVLDKDDPNKNVLKEDKLPDVKSAYKLYKTDTQKSQSESDLNINIYQNPNALALGYMVSQDITRINAFGNDNPFNSQNLLLSTISGNTTFTSGGGFDDWHKYYKPITITKEMRLNEVYTEPYGKQTNFREIVPAGQKHAGDPTVDIFLETESEEPLYLFFKTENQSKVNLWLADQWNEEAGQMLNTDGTAASSLGSYFEGDDYRILYVGSFPKGQKLQLRMTLLTDQAGTKEKYTIIQEFFFVHFDYELFEQDINSLKSNQWELTKYGGRTLEGKITAQNDQIMMTSIPAEPGWEVWVDGVKYKHPEQVPVKNKDGEVVKMKNVDAGYVTLFQAMIGVELEPGEHVVKMKYTPPGLKIGLFLLVLGLAGCVLIFLDERKNNATVKLIRENRKKGIYELPYEDDPEPKERAPKHSADKSGKDDESKKQIETLKKQLEEMSSSMVADELIKLKQLMDDGVLTKEEFEQQKKKLLNQ